MEAAKLKWVLGIGLGAVTVIWLAMEIATVDDKGKGFGSYFKAFKKSLIGVISLFVVAGVVYYGLIY